MSGNDRPIVLFINHWAARLGGAEHSLLDILKAMAGGCECHLVTVEEGALAEMARAAGVASHVVACPMRQPSFLRQKIIRSALFSIPDTITFLKYVLKVHSIVKRLGPALIHANVPKSHMTLFFLFALGYRGHGCFHLREIFAKRSVASTLYAALFPKRNASVIAISLAVRDSLPKRLREKSTVIYNGVFVRETPRPAAGAREGVRFLYCGRIVPWKGCHILVEMFHEAILRLPAASMTLTLMGDTSYWPQRYRAELADDIRRREIDKCCVLAPNACDVRPVYAGHDVFVNASYREPFGRSMAEAQGAGLAVASFDSGGVSEIVEHGVTGCLVPYGDKDAFVKVLVDFVRQPRLARAMGERGRIRARKHFNRDVQAPAIRDFLLRTVGGGATA